MRVRVDKFIWCCRIAKTRSKATEWVKKGKVKLNNESIKPSKEVQVGDIIQVNRVNALFEYKVIALLANRVGAKIVNEYIEDLTKPEEMEKYKAYQQAQRAYNEYGTGKPSKKDRRILDDFLNWETNDE
jgi:ribosome-associated heat shock protein Hsp15